MSYLFLAIAIVGEVAATTALKFCDGSMRPLPYGIVLVGYATALLLLSLALRSVPVCIAYAIWAGSGTALIVITGALVHRQIPDAIAALGIAMITIGVVVLQASAMSVHD
jgi:small multidrug resistance pump